MNEFLVPEPVGAEVAHELRLTTTVATDDNWQQLRDKGWRVVSSGPSYDWYLHDVVPMNTLRATTEASRRAGVYLEPTSQECGRVAMGFISNEPMWHDWGYGTSQKPSRVAIANPEPTGDELFIDRISETEAQLAVVGGLVLDCPLWHGRRNILYGRPILRAAGDYLAGTVQEIDLVEVARSVHEQRLVEAAELERLMKLQRPKTSRLHRLRSKIAS